MKKTPTINLKFWLPAIIVSAFLCFTVSGIFYIYQSTLERIDSESKKHVKSILADTLYLVNYTFANANANASELQRLIANLNLIDEVQEVFMFDVNGMIHYSSSFASRGRQISDIVDSQTLNFLDSGSVQNSLKIARSDDRILGLATLETPNDNGFAKFSVFINYTLKHKLDRALLESYYQLLPTIFFVVFITFLVLLVLKMFVCKPLSSIKALLERIKTGENNINNPISGKGELVHIGEALSEAGKLIRLQIKSINERENRLRVTLNSIADGVIVCNYKAEIISINPVAEKLIGCVADEVLSKPIEATFKAYSLDFTGAVHPIQDVLTSGEEVNLHNHTRLQTKAGFCQISYSAAPIQDDDEIIGVILVFRDVSKEYQLRSILKQNVNFLEKLIQISPSITFILKKDKKGEYGFSYISESFSRYQDLNFQKWTEDNSYWINFVHEDDRPLLIWARDQALAKQGENISIQLRFIDNNGACLTFRVNLVAITEVVDLKETLEIVGVATDITEHISAAKNNLLLGEILEQSLNEIYTFDFETLLFTQVNYGARKNLGYTAEELKELTPLDLKREMKKEDFEQVIAPLIKAKKEKVEFETFHYRKDGTKYPVSITLQLSESDNRKCFVAVVTDITEKKQAESRINYLAFHDTLTQLPNRTLFDERMNQVIYLSERNDQKFALLFIDLDRFKIINDTLGHNVGDELLKVLATRMNNIVRQIDTVSRSGGDEFAVLLVQTDASGAAHVADKLLEEISKPINVEQNTLHVTASIGISLYPENGKSVSELMKRADNAMYQAKYTKPNSYHFYTESMHRNMQHRMMIESQLRVALEKNQFFMVYQPQLELKTNKIIGIEALIRWKHCSLGAVSPAMFIPIAEESGLINDIGDWVLKEVIMQIAKWRHSFKGNVVTSINVSAKQFKDERLLDKITMLLKEKHVAPSDIEIEITESTAMQNIELTTLQMNRLAQAGISLSMDDFGTGFSSLNSLKKFPFNKLKIDKSFIDDVLFDKDDLAIVEAIITLAKRLDLTTVAEGVESEPQQEFLAEKGCEAIQGYVFSKPLDPDAMLALLVTNA